MTRRTSHRTSQGITVRLARTRNPHRNLTEVPPLSGWSVVANDTTDAKHAPPPGVHTYVVTVHGVLYTIRPNAFRGENHGYYLSARIPPKMVGFRFGARQPRIQYINYAGEGISGFPSADFRTPDEAAEAAWAFNEKRVRPSIRGAFEHDYRVGDILYTSWGYDETYVSFYQVTATPSAKKITIRPIAHQVVSTAMTSERVVPVPGEFTGKSMDKIPNRHGVKITDYATAVKWEGQPLSQSAQHSPTMEEIEAIKEANRRREERDRRENPRRRRNAPRRRR